MSDELKDFLADLVTCASWSATFLPRVLQAPPGQWMAIPALCEGLTDAVAAHAALTSGYEFDVMATWLDHPCHFEDMCLILFYLEDEMAPSVAVVNRTHVLQHLAS